MQNLNMNSNTEEFMDLLYFGYEYSEGAKTNEEEFVKEIKEKFPIVRLENAYDSIKGYRQEVYLPKIEEDNYRSWLIGMIWYEMSLTMQLMMMDENQKEKFEKFILLAKIQYPSSFKSVV